MFDLNDSVEKLALPALTHMEVSARTGTDGAPTQVPLIGRDMQQKTPPGTGGAIAGVLGFEPNKSGIEPHIIRVFYEN
jgi:hypothetical protein